MNDHPFELTLRGFVEDAGFSVVKLGAPFSKVVDYCGEPTAVIDPQEIGLDDRCKIWNYEFLQVWSDVLGDVDRIFLQLSEDAQPCSNDQFHHELADLRDRLKECDSTAFCRVIGCEPTRKNCKTDWSEFRFQDGNTEVFATFCARTEGGPQYLAMLRVNS